MNFCLNELLALSKGDLLHHELVTSLLRSEEHTPAYLQWREETFREGVQAERRATIENLLRVRFGSLDDELSAIITQLLELPPEEFTRLLLQSSREELLNRFER